MNSSLVSGELGTFILKRDSLIIFSLIFTTIAEWSED